MFGRRQTVNWGADGYTKVNRPPGQLSGTYGIAVNQLFVDAFEMKSTGLPITDPESGYYEQNPYTDRDPRFEFTVIHNGQTVMNRKLQIYHLDENNPNIAGSKDLKITAGIPEMGYTQTGYYSNKWMGNTFGAHLKCLWPYIRLAEVYLNFAEAANEAWGSPDQKDGRCKYSAEEAINIVRNRAQMPDINNKFLNQTDFRERIRNERRVEFGFEEHRVFDLRRWLIGTQPQYRDIWRMKITKLKNGYDKAKYPTGFKFERELLISRIYEPKQNLFVIKLDDTNIGPNFKQNPGW